MSKKYMTVGSICKRKDGNGDYLKVGMDISLKKGDILNLNSKKDQLEHLETMVESGRLSPEVASKRRERINQIPEFVRFEIVLVRDE